MIEKVNIHLSFDEIMSFIADFLDIDFEIKFYSDEKIRKAYVAPDSPDVIYVQQRLSDIDCLFAIAHEARHIWQLKNNINFDDYKSVEIEEDINIYNDQYQELDAHAFATAICVYFWNVKPLFEGLDESVKKKIYQKAKYFEKKVSNFYYDLE